MSTRIPLFLVPGTLCTPALWESQIKDLTILADVQPVDISAMEDLRSFAAELLATAPPTFAVAGFSLGGILAFELMRQAPERISHLALISTNARADTQESRAAKLEQLALAREAGVTRLVRSKLLPAYFSPRADEPKALEDRVLAMAESAGLSAFEAQIAAVLGRPDSREDLPRFRCPTQVVCGADDVICPPERHQEIASAIPDSELRIIRDCGHMSVIERPLEVTKALRELLATPAAS